MTCFVSGVANNFGCFFLSGLPGGLDYVMLVLVRSGFGVWGLGFGVEDLGFGVNALRFRCAKG